MDAKFQVGQKVIVKHPERGAHETDVTKVGRSLVYAAGMAFYADTGAERRGPNAGGYAYRICTPEEHAEEMHRICLRGALRGAGIQFVDFDGRRFTTSQLERLLAVATDAKDPS